MPRVLPFRTLPGSRTGRGFDLTIELSPPSAGAAAVSSAGICTPSVTGLQWCLYSDGALYTLVSDGGTPPVYTMQPTEEEPVCSSDDIAITLSGGYVPSDQDGYYVFQLVGETCGEPVEWSYQFFQDGAPVWSDLFQPYENGDMLVIPVSGSATYAKGEARISATVAGQTFGPIMIMLLSSY